MTSVSRRRYAQKRKVKRNSHDATDSISRPKLMFDSFLTHRHRQLFMKQGKTTHLSAFVSVGAKKRRWWSIGTGHIHACPNTANAAKLEKMLHRNLIEFEADKDIKKFRTWLLLGMEIKLGGRRWKNLENWCFLETKKLTWGWFLSSTVGPMYHQALS